MSKIVLEHVREEPIVQGMQNNGSHQNCVCLFINFAFCIRFTYGVFVENLGGKKKSIILNLLSEAARILSCERSRKVCTETAFYVLQ